MNLKWVPRRVSAFIAFTLGGYYLYFDLLKDAFNPLYFDTTPEKKISSCSVDVSPCHAGGVTAFVALRSLKSTLHFSIFV